MKRLYDQLIQNHCAQFQQMLFLAGPRQVGKTTIAKHIEKQASTYHYLNWDIEDDKELILRGSKQLGEYFKLNQLQEKPVIVFDEIHKYANWKNFLKGFIDQYKGKAHILVTGSSKLNVYRKGADSLMGRYFLYRIHPLTVRECINPSSPNKLIHPPQTIKDTDYDRLFQFGGFPEPFIKHNQAFSSQWHRLKQQQLFREDIKDLTHIQEVAQLELLAELLKNQAGQLLNTNELGKRIGVATTTITRWMKTLSEFYYCFTLQPWHKNISRSLIKTPKIFLWDWSIIKDPGAKFENFIASHLHKAIQLWVDTGLGDFGLYYLRDKDKREVDFLITKDDKPWILVEAKTSEKNSVSKALYYFQKQTKAEYAFQVTHNLEFVDQDCFKHHEPLIVPAKTFLSQLI